jgi:hypothetical protein
VGIGLKELKMEINLEDPKSCATCAASILFGDEMVRLPDDEAVYCSNACAQNEGEKEKYRIKSRLEETECEYCGVPLYVGDIITYWDEVPYCSDAHASVHHALSKPKIT